MSTVVVEFGLVTDKTSSFSEVYKLNEALTLQDCDYQIKTSLRGKNHGSASFDVEDCLVQLPLGVIVQVEGQ